MLQHDSSTYSHLPVRLRTVSLTSVGHVAHVLVLVMCAFLDLPIATTSLASEEQLHNRTESLAYPSGLLTSRNSIDMASRVKGAASTAALLLLLTVAAALIQEGVGLHSCVDSALLAAALSRAQRRYASPRSFRSANPY